MPGNETWSAPMPLNPLLPAACALLPAVLMAAAVPHQDRALGARGVDHRVPWSQAPGWTSSA